MTRTTIFFYFFAKQWLSTYRSGQVMNVEKSPPPMAYTRTALIHWQIFTANIKKKLCSLDIYLACKYCHSLVSNYHWSSNVSKYSWTALTRIRFSFKFPSKSFSLDLLFSHLNSHHFVSPLGVRGRGTQLYLRDFTVSIFRWWGCLKGKLHRRFAGSSSSRKLCYVCCVFVKFILFYYQVNIIPS